MKRLTLLAVITFCLLACSNAFGQFYVLSPQYQLGFLSSDMKTLYCDYESFGTDGAIAAGIDAQGACGAPDGVMIGLQATFPPSRLPLAGTYYVMADSLIDASCDCFSGDQAISITGTTAYNIHAPHFGWELLINTYDGFYAYLDSWGYLTNTLPLAKTEKASQKKAPSRISLDNLYRDPDLMK